MRIALLSDIHGNFIALEGVLADIERAAVDQIVCLGDVAFHGPQPRECLARLRDLGCRVVMGNTDEFFVRPPDADPYNQDDRRLMEMLEWASGQLSQADLDFVKSFEPRVETPLQSGQTLLCFHGSPDSNTGLILITTPENELARTLGHHRATVMAGGHTHTQMLRRFDETLVINPGSVGMPLERSVGSQPNRHPPWSEYAILSASPEHLAVEFRRMPLEVTRLRAAARASGMPRAEAWAVEWLEPGHPD